MHIQQNVPLKQYNTFGIPALARFFVEIKHINDLLALLDTTKYQQHQHLILGGGSNVLFTNNYNGLLILNGLQGIELIKETPEHVFIKVAGGENWHNLVLWSVQRGWSGLENLALIPGSVGAAPIQNIGAYGAELCDVFYELEAVHLPTASIHTISKIDCKFAYRNSRFKQDWKNQFFISSVSLQLNKQFTPNISYGSIKQALESQYLPPTPQNISKVVTAIRNSKLPNPSTLGSAGSFFKNPIISVEQYHHICNQNPQLNIPNYPINTQKVKLPAGWLIEQCGWKSKRLQGAGVYHKHALVLVNHAVKTGNEIWQLATNIQQSVYQKFGIELSPEVNII